MILFSSVGSLEAVMHHCFLLINIDRGLGSGVMLSRRFSILLPVQVIFQ